MSTAPWQTLIDDIPIDGTLDNTGAVIVDNNKLKATYTDDSSRIIVYSKTNSMSGTYQWKVVSVDKSGHTQETETRNLYVKTTASTVTNSFPLAVLNISGLGNPYLNSYNISNVKSTYYTSSSSPIFYGIAWTNSKVTLKLTDQNCKTDCTKTYSTTANSESRYGINVPKGNLKFRKKYTTHLSVSLDDKYNELPEFILSIGGATLPNSTPSLDTSTTTPQP